MKVPMTDLARRVAAIVRRQERTPWSDKEVQVYKKLYRAGAFNEIDIAKVERYQTFQRYQLKKGRPAFHRRGLLQLLNHWGEEVDHGTEHDELHPVIPKPRVIIQMPPRPSEPLVLSVEDQERSDKFWAEYRARKKNGFCPENEEAGAPLLNPNPPRSTFQKIQREMGK